MYEVVQAPFDHPDAIMLRNELRLGIASAYGRPDTEPGPPPTASDVEVFPLAYDDGKPVACGGLRPLTPDGAEIKRMYVAPTHRGTGLATLMLQALEEQAVARGITTIRLETGDGLHAATGFYEREGYTPIEPYGHYVGSALSRCYERQLQP